MENNKTESLTESSLLVDIPEVVERAKENLTSLPKLSALDGKVVPLEEMLWDYAIEITTDDMMVCAHWDFYGLLVDEVCKGLIDDEKYIEANILPIFSIDKSDSFVRVLILIGQKNQDVFGNLVGTHKCLNVDFHRQFRNESIEYHYKSYPDSDVVSLPAHEVTSVIDRYRFKGELHYLPYKTQLPFYNVSELINFKLHMSPDGNF